MIYLLIFYFGISLLGNLIKFIGMFRQNNLQAARSAFEQVVNINPEYADGFVNLSRILIKESYLQISSVNFAYSNV